MTELRLNIEATTRIKTVLVNEVPTVFWGPLEHGPRKKASKNRPDRPDSSAVADNENECDSLATTTRPQTG